MGETFIMNRPTEVFGLPQKRETIVENKRKQICFYGSEIGTIRLTPDGEDLQTYINENDEVCVYDEETEEEVIMEWG